ncbi:DUF3144 domain-containing protein [Rhodanobacter sp. AS-Z3]|uniref:DUF3144 domain-containing protein n=1 Tax=Rhodanobacter sp. AS-Z3 TaxID=3031330 RepID=UPI00247A95F6|nr:DUF3144 domain-containing protein [Rhodanobacter sp. AS-Z3]WEN14667.1 DUF3144 domain-containing protein [Rhodanobacter sp. AS-Z3]WEN15445.1 DUF3144 domain-containing protein [Rhodanobacter sp. AS-Z3]
MTNQVDDNFYNRADGYIALANEHCLSTGKGKVSASFLYGAARFNAYVGAINSGSLQRMTEEKENIVSYYLKEYEDMLRENLTDYIENYDDYMATPSGGEA